VQFLGTSNNLIDSDVLERLINSYKEPTLYDMDSKLRIFEKPQPNTQYVIGTDPAKGTGEHDSTCQILKITNYNPFKAEQVAVWQDSHTDIYTFANIVYRLALYYNNAHLLVENNLGDTVVTQLW